VHEEDATDAEATPSFDVKSQAPTASAANADVAPEGAQDDNSDGNDEVGSP
jgi:hypothetical protein